MFKTLTIFLIMAIPLSLFGQASIDLDKAKKINQCGESLGHALMSEIPNGCIACEFNQYLESPLPKCTELDIFLAQLNKENIPFEQMTSEPLPTEECKEIEEEIEENIATRVNSNRARGLSRNLYLADESKWTSADHKTRCDSINNIINGNPVQQCQVSHCVTAPYYAILKHIKKRPDFDKCLKQYFECKPPRKLGEAYHTLNGYYGLETLMQEYGLGTYDQHTIDDIIKEDKFLDFKTGSPIFFQKTEKYNYGGHTGIFEKFLIKNGKPSHICFWSSNMWNKEFEQEEDKIIDKGSRKGGVNSTCFELDKKQFMYIGLGTYYE